MAKKKTLEDDVLLNLIERFYKEHCNGNVNALKLPKITEYIVQNGYPNYAVTTLRRNQVARQYIDSLKETATDNQNLLVAYKTIDVEEFIQNNKTTSALKRELINLDAYYKSVADSSLIVLEKNKKLVSELQKTESSLTSALDEITALKQEIATLKSENNILKSRNQRLTDIVQDYVYADIANELLAQDGELVNVNTQINADSLEKNIITSSTKINTSQERPNNTKSDSNVIKGLFEEFKE